MPNIELTEVEFSEVKLGGVLFDPVTSLRFQKVDEPHYDERSRYGYVNVHRSEHNAIGEFEGKNFAPDDKVKIPTFK